MSISPYLKKLHFLPVQYRIQFKIRLLVYKCINNLAPAYLKSLINVPQSDSHGLRINEDYFRLVVPPKPNLARTSYSFSYMGPELWNKLPYSIRTISDLSQFKSKVKAYFYGLAFKNIPDI